MISSGCRTKSPANATAALIANVDASTSGRCLQGRSTGTRGWSQRSRGDREAQSVRLIARPREPRVGDLTDGVAVDRGFRRARSCSRFPPSRHGNVRATTRHGRARFSECSCGKPRKMRQLASVTAVFGRVRGQVHGPPGRNGRLGSRCIENQPSSASFPGLRDARVRLGAEECPLLKPVRVVKGTYVLGTRVEPAARLSMRSCQRRLGVVGNQDARTALRPLQRPPIHHRPVLQILCAPLPRTRLRSLPALPRTAAPRAPRPAPTPSPFRARSPRTTSP